VHRSGDAKTPGPIKVDCQMGPPRHVLVAPLPVEGGIITLYHHLPSSLPPHLRLQTPTLTPLKSGAVGSRKKAVASEVA
jgi:hypothetical protein